MSPRLSLFKPDDADLDEAAMGLRTIFIGLIIACGSVLTCSLAPYIGAIGWFLLAVGVYLLPMANRSSPQVLGLFGLSILWILYGLWAIDPYLAFGFVFNRWFNLIAKGPFVILLIGSCWTFWSIPSAVLRVAAALGNEKLRTRLVFCRRHMLIVNMIVLSLAFGVILRPLGPFSDTMRATALVVWVLYGIPVLVILLTCIWRAAGYCQQAARILDSARSGGGTIPARFGNQPEEPAELAAPLTRRSLLYADHLDLNECRQAFMRMAVGLAVAPAVVVPAPLGTMIGWLSWGLIVTGTMRLRSAIPAATPLLLPALGLAPILALFNYFQFLYGIPWDNSPNSPESIYIISTVGIGLLAPAWIWILHTVMRDFAIMNQLPTLRRIGGINRIVFTACWFLVPISIALIESGSVEDTFSALIMFLIVGLVFSSIGTILLLWHCAGLCGKQESIAQVHSP